MPFIRVTRGLSARWFVHRWHAGQEYTAWRHRRAWVGATVSCGWWRVSVALLRSA